MMKRFRMSFAVLAFAMLITPAARATVLTFEEINIGFGHGFQAVGQIAFASGPPFPPDTYITVLEVPSLYLNGSPLQFVPSGLGGAFIEPWIYTTGDFSLPREGLAFPLGTLPNVFSDFTLNGEPAVNGTVFVCARNVTTGPVGACEASAVPLPAALPLFSIGLLALAGFTAWRSRRSPVVVDG